MIKVSIIVPIYNVAQYIVRCVDSVINQTYTNIECILVDDCSPDNSIALAEQRLSTYTGNIEFKILHHEQNKGLSGARNTGTYASTGDYLYYLDSDDEITPDCIETLVALVDKYPDVEMVQGNTQTIPEPPQESDWRNILHKNFPEYVNDNNWIRDHFYNTKKKHIPVNAWNKLVKRDFLLSDNLLFKEGIIHEDELWMFWTVKKLNTIAFSVKYTYNHYINEGTIMTSKNKYPSWNSWYIIYSEIFANIDSEECRLKYLTSLLYGKIYIYCNDKKLKKKYNALLNNQKLSFRLFIRIYRNRIFTPILTAIRKYLSIIITFL